MRAQRAWAVNGNAVRAALLALLAVLAAAAGVVDRVAVVVGNIVITESEILQELRLSAFQNGDALDLGPEKRRAAAERLVDQQLIRAELQLSQYPEPSDQEVASMLAEFRRGRYRDDAEFRAGLAKYGVAEDDFKRYLRWQLTAVGFVDARFRIGVPAGSEQSADRVQPGAAVTAGSSVDEQMENWLKEARTNTRIQFKKEAFQ